MMLAEPHLHPGPSERFLHLRARFPWYRGLWHLPAFSRAPSQASTAAGSAFETASLRASRTLFRQMRNADATVAGRICLEGMNRRRPRKYSGFAP